MRQFGSRILMFLAMLAGSLKMVLPEGPLFEGLATISGQDWMTIIGMLYLAYTSPTQMNDLLKKAKRRVM